MAILGSFGMTLLGYVAFRTATELRYSMDGSVVLGHLTATRFSGRNEQVTELTYTFEVPDGRTLTGHEVTPTSRHLGKQPIPVEFVRSDPAVHRPYYAGRLLDDLFPMIATLLASLFFLGTSIIPYLGHRWRVALDGRLEREGVTAEAVVTSVSSDALSPNYVIVRYDYSHRNGTKHSGEAYGYRSRVHIGPGDRGVALFDPRRPHWSMWRSDARVA